MKCFVNDSECLEDRNVIDNKIFVVMPFGHPFDDVYELIKDAALSDGFEITRADRVPQIGFVMCNKICKQIQQAKYIIVDITKNNLNVFYEFGLSYALRKKIILIGSIPIKDALTFDLVGKDKADYIQYKELEDVQNIIKKIKHGDINVCSFSDEPQDNMQKSILSVNLHKDNILSRLQYKSVEEAETKITSKWKKNILEIGNNVSIKRLCKKIIKNKIIVLDTTPRSPIIYFFLGLGHGFEREMVPVTYMSTIENKVPFDVAALWHVIFQDKDDLAENLIHIFKKINDTWQEENKRSELKKFWKPIICSITKMKKPRIKIIVCARPWLRKLKDDELLGKGKNEEYRASVDRWDYHSVAVLSSFLPTLIPNISIEQETISGFDDISEMSPLQLEEKISKIEKDFIKNENCIIVGSPEANDVSEIALAKIFNIPPYRGLARGVQFINNEEVDENSIRTLLNKQILIKDNIDQEYIYFNKAIENITQLKKRLEKSGVKKTSPILKIWGETYGKSRRHRKNGFVISKISVFRDHSITPITSSFHVSPEAKEGNISDEGIFYLEDSNFENIHKAYKNDPVKKNKFNEYGLLTIAQNPTNEDKFIIVLSGFSGPSTFAMAKLISDINHRSKIKILNNRIKKEHLTEKKPFEIVIKASCLQTSSGISKVDDTRGIQEIFLGN